MISDAFSFLSFSFFSQNHSLTHFFVDHFVASFHFPYRLMDSPKITLKISVTLILIISLTLFPSNSEGSSSAKDSKILKGNKLVLGSRPPRCINKCLSCRPCMAALVISPHHKDGHIQNHNHKEAAQRDEGYYLLSWKCKCGNKFFQP